MPPEALKADEGVSADIMLDLLHEVCDKEEAPKEWRGGHIVKLPKKGDLTKCQN